MACWGDYLTQLKVPIHMYIIFLLSCWLSHQSKYGKLNSQEHCFFTFERLYCLRKKMIILNDYKKRQAGLSFTHIVKQLLKCWRWLLLMCHKTAGRREKTFFGCQHGSTFEIQFNSTFETNIFLQKLNCLAPSILHSVPSTLVRSCWCFEMWGLEAHSSGTMSNSKIWAFDLYI